MINDYWRSYQGRQYVYRQYAALGEITEQVAKQGNGCAKSHGVGEKRAVRATG